MTIEEISPELFLYELYDANLLWSLDEALYCASAFGYCDASRLSVRPKSGMYAMMITWGNGDKNWCHINDNLLKAIRERLAMNTQEARHD